MENKKENTNFVIYGTFKMEDADILKREFEKQGIPVKVIYPGTNVGKEITAGAYFTGYQFMIRVCDFRIAEEIREKFGIEIIKDREKMPIPKTYKWAKSGLSRYSLIGLIISIMGLVISDVLSDRGLVSESIPFYFIVILFISIFLWLCTTVYNVFRKE